MSPEERCSRCGKERIFHEDEVEGARAGEILCMNCSLDEQFNRFLGEVLDGKHKALIDQMYQQLIEDQEE